ncbi:MAG: pseudouridine synthase [Geobacteraceae bacterium]
MKERLQKILSRAGVSSRRAAEEIILAGRVAVNGVVINELGAKADPEHDAITVDGKRIGTDIARVYLVLYKPAGYMTTLKDPQGRPLVIDLLKGLRERVYPVGRLDYNTEGLLLLTNDGEWANTLAHPRHEVDKEYHVRVQGRVSPVQIQRLTAGVELEDGMTAPALVRVVRESENNTWLSITIHEGRYRQVRRMCEAVSLSVVRLKRVRYGFLGLEGLSTGKYRFLNADEAERLRRESRGGNAAAASVQPVEKHREKKVLEQKRAGKKAPAATRAHSTEGKNRSRHRRS